MKNTFYVIREDHGKFIPYDILPYLSREWGGLSELDRNIQKHNLKDWVDRELRYQFWARCEYELILSSWPPSRFSEGGQKVDIYWQASPNLDLITKLFAENEGIS